MRNLKDIPNHILVDDILYGTRANKNSMIAIESSVTQPKRIYLDEGYIKEKLLAVKDINKWLPKYFQEARDRKKEGKLSAEEIEKLAQYI